MHPKVMAAGNEAAGIFARCLSYCGKYLTDGRVPMTVAMSIAGTKKSLDHAVDSGFFERLESGDLYVRDYSHYNPLRDEVEGKRDERRERAAKAANKRWADERERANGHSQRNAPSNT